MKKTYMNSRLAVAVATLGLMGVSSGALAATVNSTTDATVVSPIEITANTAGPLKFGTFSPTATAGTVKIDANTGARTVTNVVALTGDPGQKGTYDVAGSASATYAVTLPASVSLSDGAATATTMSFVPSYYSATAASATSAKLNTSGADTLGVGGTLDVGANQKAATYSGSYDVTVEYN